MKITDKHTVRVELSELHEIGAPPRKKLWDLLPEWLCLFIIRKLHINPQPTPWEVWTIRYAALRIYYKRFYGVVALLNRDSLSREYALEQQNVDPKELN